MYYTVIRTDNVDALKNIIGFGQIKKQLVRVNSYPKSYKSDDKDILIAFVDHDLLKPNKQD